MQKIFPLNKRYSCDLHLPNIGEKATTKYFPVAAAPPGAGEAPLPSPNSWHLTAKPGPWRHRRAPPPGGQIPPALS